MSRILHRSLHIVDLFEHMGLKHNFGVYVHTAPIYVYTVQGVCTGSL